MTGTAHPGARETPLWLRMLRRYIVLIALGNLVWEFVQLPLYTIWREGTPGQMAFAALHCTGGDLLIATGSLVAALLVAGRGWPVEDLAYRHVGAIAVALGLAYTVFSERLNVIVRKSWAYSELMPVVPAIEVGLSPLLQWIFIPLAALWWARRPAG